MKGFWACLGVIIFSGQIGFAAQEADKCVFTLKCESDAKKFSLEFKSPTNDCTNDDMEIRYKTGNLSRKLELKKAWFYFTNHIAKTQKSICKTDDKQAMPFAIYDAGKNRAIAFLKVSGRPGFDRVHYVLLNTKVGAVIETGGLGSTKSPAVPVLKSAAGFKLRIIRDSMSFSDQVQCNCDVGFIDDWMQVAVKDDKVSFAWLENPDQPPALKADAKN